MDGSETANMQEMDFQIGDKVICVLGNVHSVSSGSYDLYLHLLPAAPPAYPMHLVDLT